MGIGESVRVSLEGLRANKMRSLLTMLGIIIGIAAVIGILTVGNGLTGSITGSMSSLGATNITVFLQEKAGGMGGMETILGVASPEEEDLITDEMLEALRQRYGEAVAGISVSASAGSGVARDGRLYANVSLTGINEEYLAVNNTDLLAGRTIRQEDLDGRRSVCVVSDRLVENLYQGDADAALGDEVRVELNGEYQSFRIVGIYEYDASMSISFSAEEDVTTSLYIPITTANHLTGSPEGYSTVTVQASAGTDSAAMAQSIREFLSRYYANNEDYGVSAMAMSTMVESMSAIMDTLSIAISVIAGISLLVGGIGVMNIMLVSVTERTREIGIRKALGATNNNIRIQFVVESVIVCLIGGVIGILLGAVLGYVGSSLLSEACLPRPSYIALAVGFSMAIGIFFGYYPANKAARLDPIEALRYECARALFFFLKEKEPKRTFARNIRFAYKLKQR